MMGERIVCRTNILTIKRVDPHAKDIVDSLEHVAVFKFDEEKKKWDTKAMKASFFIYTRNAEPYHSVFVDYISDTKVLVDPITAHTKLKIDSPFMFTRNEQNRTRCYRFNTLDQCNRIAALVERIISSTKQQLQQINQNAGIFSMLANAQANFDNSIAGNHDATQPGTNFNKAPANAMASLSVMNFFAAAKPATEERPIFKRMLSEPVRVDQIEKHQLNGIPREQKYASQQELNNSLKPSANFKRIPSPKPKRSHKTVPAPVPVPDFCGTMDASTTLTSTGPSTTDPWNTTHVNPVELMPKSMQDVLKNVDINVSTTDQGAKPTLMSPIMFSVTKDSTDGTGNPVLPQTATKLTSNAAQMRQTEANAQPEPLTHSQMLQAMSHLMKSDNDFVKKLHEAYLKSFNEMLSS